MPTGPARKRWKLIKCLANLGLYVRHSGSILVGFYLLVNLFFSGVFNVRVKGSVFENDEQKRPVTKYKSRGKLR